MMNRRKIVAWVGITIAGFCISFSMAQSLTHLPGLEPERVSPSPDATPTWVRNDLPKPKDENDKRDVFLYLDGNSQGRIMHFQIPAMYVSMAGRPVDRHATSLSFSMLWPDLKSTNDPDAIAAFHHNKNRVLDEQVDVEIGPKSIQNLTYSASRLLAKMHYAKTKAPWITYKDIDPVSGFSQGIRETNEKIVPGITVKDSIKDYYIEWDVLEQPSKFMTCQPYTPRPPCEVSTYDYQSKNLYGLSIRFHAKFLPQLPEILRVVEAKINTFVVKTYPANFRENK